MYYFRTKIIQIDNHANIFRTTKVTDSNKQWNYTKLCSWQGVEQFSGEGVGLSRRDIPVSDRAMCHGDFHLHLLTTAYLIQNNQNSLVSTLYAANKSREALQFLPTYFKSGEQHIESDKFALRNYQEIYSVLPEKPIWAFASTLYHTQRVV